MTRLVAFLLLVCACQPWYRDAQRAGERATDRKHSAKLLNDANAAKDRGDHARAAALIRRAINDVPDQDADTYLLLARESFAANDVAGGRAACRRGMQLWSTDSRFRALLVEQWLADDLTARAIDEGGFTTFDAIAADSTFAPHVDALRRALSAERTDTIAAELELWLAHYGIPDHALLVTARDAAAAKLVDRFTQIVDRADADLAAGHLARALALYSEAYRLLPSSVLDAHFASFAKAAQQVTDPESVDAGAYALALQANKDAEAGHLGLAIHAYRKAVARAPWWADARRNLASLYDDAGMSAMASAERALADRLTAR